MNVIYKCFQFGCVQMLFLTLYKSRLLSNPGKEALRKHCGKRIKCWLIILVTSIFSFFHNVFCPSQKEFLFLSYVYFVVCKCIYLDQSQNLLFGKGLNKEFVDIISYKYMRIRVKRTVCCFNSIFTKRQNFGLDQIGGICRRQNKCESKMEI